jgi:Tfp pilus assembly protein PilE
MSELIGGALNSARELLPQAVLIIIAVLLGIILPVYRRIQKNLRVNVIQKAYSDQMHSPEECRLHMTQLAMKHREVRRSGHALMISALERKVYKAL